MNEAETRAEHIAPALCNIWSDPSTRKALLEGLAEKGFSKAPLAEMQKIIEADNCDLFGVLAYVGSMFRALSR